MRKISSIALSIMGFLSIIAGIIAIFWGLQAEPVILREPEKARQCAEGFLKAINDRTASYSALEMILAGLQEILPGKNTEKKLSQQISSLRSRFDNDIMSRILAYIEECRNKLTHFGIIPKYDNIQNLYGTDENENSFRLA